MSTEETPYRISVPEDKINRLRQRLTLTEFPDELEDSGRQYGAPLEDIKRLVSRWKDGYDWRVHEARLNDSLPQFVRDITVTGHGTLNIHYVHRKSPLPQAIPLLFVHGWPGSFVEVAGLLEPLTSPDTADQPAFHVVGISLPGFGFSEAPRKKGFSTAQYAEVCNNLMISLGYNKYVTQGGDWGFWITRKLASLHGGTNVLAWHTNYPNGEAPKLTSSPLVFMRHVFTPYTELEREGIRRNSHFLTEGSGYFAQQSTQPQTLGYSLTDSPVGLLGWIYEKLLRWTDDYPWDDDEVLTWVSIYLFSRAGPAATLRIYYEVVHARDRSIRPSEIPKVPMGISLFPREIRWSPASWIRASCGNLVFTSIQDRGGHFAAHEQPQKLVKDLRDFFGSPGSGVLKHFIEA